MAHYDETEKVSVLYADAEGLKIRHSTMPDGFYVLKLSHDNYDTLASVAVMAAANRYALRIRSSEDSMNIVYLAVYWQ